MAQCGVLSGGRSQLQVFVANLSSLSLPFLWLMGAWRVFFELGIGRCRQQSQIFVLSLSWATSFLLSAPTNIPSQHTNKPILTAERCEQATYVTVNMGDQRGIRRWEE
jgi:hypothetical protein